MLLNIRLLLSLGILAVENLHKYVELCTVYILVYISEPSNRELSASCQVIGLTYRIPEQSVVWLVFFCVRRRLPYAAWFCRGILFDMCFLSSFSLRKKHEGAAKMVRVNRVLMPTLIRKCAWHDIVDHDYIAVVFFVDTPVSSGCWLLSNSLHAAEENCLYISC